MLQSKDCIILYYFLQMNNQIINGQILEIKSKESISNVTYIQNNTYKVTYSPLNTRSPYSHLNFTLKITIPDRYPQLAPHLVFLNQIYHLNVDPVTGQVHMPILSDDWSPYLTLSNVIESLDNILEEPDINYGATQTLIEEYQMDYEKYAGKLSKMIEITHGVMENLSESIVQHVEQLNQLQSIEEETEKNENGLKSSRKLYQRQESNKPFFEKEKKQQMLIQQNDSQISANQIIMNEGGSTVLFLSQENKKIEKLKNKKDETSINTLNMKLNMLKSDVMVDKVNNTKDNLKKQILKEKPQELPSQFDNIHKNLRNNDHLIDTLIKTCESMQSNLKTMSNKRMKDLMSKELQKEWQMIQELLALSSKLKLKLFNLIKKESESLLR